MFDSCDYPHLAQFGRGRDRQKRKSKNQLKVVASRNRVRVAARGSLPAPEGEVLGRAVGAIRRDKRNIKERFQVGQQRGGVVVRGQGNLGPVQVRGGGFVGYQPRSYERDAALMSAFPNLAEFRRGRDKKKRKPKTASLVARLAGKNRAKYTDVNRNMRLARKIYIQGKPGLLERFEIIPNRRS